MGGVSEICLGCTHQKTCGDTKPNDCKLNDYTSKELIGMVNRITEVRNYYKEQINKQQ